MQEPLFRWELKFEKSCEWSLARSCSAYFSGSGAIRRVEEQHTLFVEAQTGSDAIDEALKYGSGEILHKADLRSLRRLA